MGRPGPVVAVVPLPRGRRAATVRVSTASGIWLAAALAAVLPTVYGAPDRGLAPLAVEIPLAAIAAAAAIGLAPLTLALTRERTGLLPVVLALLSASAAAIHFAVIGDHFDEYWLFGVAFVGMGLAQLAWAPFVLARASRLLLVLGVALNAGIAGLWVITRTTGLPFGPNAGEPEPIGLADVVATAAEVLLVAGALVAISGLTREIRFPPRKAEAAVWVLAALAVAVTTLGLLSAVGAASSVLSPAG